MQEIAPNIYVETGYRRVAVGAALTGEGWVLIDVPTFPAEAHDWRQALHHVENQPVRYVLSTDAHRDRILSNGVMEDACIIMQEAAARAVLALEDGYITEAANELADDGNMLARIASLPLAAPNASFEEGMTLYCGGHTFELIAQPSASPGSAWIILRKEKVLFAGDSVVTGGHPYLAGHNSKAWLETLNTLRRDRFADWAIVSGRDGVIDPQDTEPLSEYLRVARRRVLSLLRNDGPRAEVARFVDELMAAFPVPRGAEEAVAARIRTGLESIYDELGAGADEDGG
jgi:glyoxylase-like metal-dependent hydrolase (beta-lactamase superfamily II)